ncbi:MULTISPECIES: hypothetical protein [Cohaesibacter]|uniref:hypothetical protein n=1 Tax=Cohaesibacter TaxID=655352 RepID=UPI0010FE36DE|nr:MULTISPECIES: hypothetical protein [Cohaesibacter]TLP43419.1 hypothetical protein FDK21_17850 [Cohaesibacter sp. CAU 1516]
MSIASAGMTAAADRLEDIAIGIANPVPDNAPETTVKAQSEVKPTDPIAPVSASPSLDPAKLVELIEAEVAFKASALATKTVASASQDLMEALR